MVRLKHLLSLGTALLLVLALPEVAHAQPGCTVIQINTGACSVGVNNSGDQVTLTGKATTPGSSAGGSGKTTSPRRGIAHADPDASDGCEHPVGKYCYGTVPKHPDPVSSASTRPVTLTDIAAFRPTPGSERMEPNSWVVPGLAANIYAVADQQLVPGTLFGRPATVRFTPVAYRWSYGDGTTAVRSTPGASWAAQGLPDFAPTPTGHVYMSEGDYVIRLSIDFRAEYRLGAATFAPVGGRINLPANELRVTVTGAKTVLVDHDCISNPQGPGC